MRRGNHATATRIISSNPVEARFLSEAKSQSKKFHSYEVVTFFLPVFCWRKLVLTCVLRNGTQIATEQRGRINFTGYMWTSTFPKLV